MQSPETHEPAVAAGRTTGNDAGHRSDAPGTIAVTINGEVRTVPSDSTLAQVLQSLALDPRAIVVEHNREILRDRTAYALRPIHAGDVLELVRFVGGG
jgi:thiamine biosynthesis protein ThiS